MNYIIGMDIGGTHTDAVLVDAKETIIATTKVTTSEDIHSGFASALEDLLQKSEVKPDEIQGVFVGTTHATNAILQMKDLYRVGVIRIAGHYPHSLPVGYSWPKTLKEKIIIASETIAGGFECHGGQLTPFNLDEADEAIGRLLESGVESIAVIGVFSPLNPEQELFVAERIKAMGGKAFPVSLSYELGGIGFIERENSTILNAALIKVMDLGFTQLQKVCQALHLNCPLMITQNDGSLIDLKQAIAHPILTISAGPTNSFIGGAKLAGITQGLIVDIGGTSTDVGVIQQGFPIRSINQSDIGGVSLNFPMPDVLSIALGGGSKITLSPHISIGPESVGRHLHSQGVSFGGEVLTLTDVALSMQTLTIPLTQPLSLSLQNGEKVFEEVKKALEQAVFKMEGKMKELPVILVGGGAALLPRSLLSPRYVIPPHYNVANAYGAALAEISGCVETVVSLKERQEVLERLKCQAKKQAIEKGADPSTVRLVEEKILPYHYVPDQMAKISIRFCGKHCFR
jgi:N-methylhydantoinase A/oxoprolinase/acetone carboxylase beta subunit